MITTRGLALYRECPRLYQLREVLGWRARAGATFEEALRAALRAWWEAKRERTEGDGPLVAALTRVDALLEPRPFERARARAVVRAYHEVYKDMVIRAVAAGEVREVRRPGSPRRVGVVIDARCRTPAGQDVLLIHRVAHEDLSDPEACLWRRLRVEAAAEVAAWAWGSPCLVTYDVVARPVHRPLVRSAARSRPEDETPPAFEDRVLAALRATPAKYFARRQWERPDVGGAVADLEQWYALAAAVGEAPPAPRNSNRCIKGGVACEFLEACSGEAALDDASRFLREMVLPP